MINLIILYLIIHSLIGNSITKELQKAYCHWKLLTKKRDTEQTVSLGADYAVRNLKHIDDNRDKSFYNFDNDLGNDRSDNARYLHNISCNFNRNLDYNIPLAEIAL